MEPRNQFQGMNSASLRRLAGRYDNPIPIRSLAPINCVKKFRLSKVTVPTDSDLEHCGTILFSITLRKNPLPGWRQSLPKGRTLMNDGIKQLTDLIRNRVMYKEAFPFRFHDFMVPGPTELYGMNVQTSKKEQGTRICVHLFVE
jgi:hypothetical protein